MLLVFLVFVVASNNFALFTNETLTITSFPNVLSNGDFQIYSYQRSVITEFPIYLSPGDQITVYGSKYNLSFYVSSADNMIVNKQSFLHRFSKWRIELSEKIVEYYPKSGALTLALILGNRSFVDPDFMEYVRFSGLAHIMALSGMHLVIFVGIFILIFQKLGVVNRNLGIVTMPFSIFYLFLGGFGIPLQRAVLFHFLGSVYKYFRIPIPSKNIFFIAFILNVGFIPNNIFALSFWLSYISVLGIVFCYKFWYDMLKDNLGKYIASSFAISLAACMMTIPILIWFFGYINIFFMVTSLLVMPIIPMMLMLCFVVVFLSVFDIKLGLLDNFIKVCYNVVYEISRIFSEHGVIFFENKLKWVLISISISTLLIVIMRKYERVE